ncbi:hypothetical protein I6N96_05600 [Enterococcus sp. BWM-S5]|uniref:Uncharacterized protein n=1 Tax=Enterococcus larvae TaxID=2794352 RepID=A0ABS4CI00_9ENTE|nr:hypothetical protein [Enterococcus larvae]MBP1045746.1 hypothetical protein [Enterococcus larvae]
MGIKKLVEDQAFTFQESKEGKIIIFYYNKQIMIVKEQRARTLSQKLANASLEEQQMILAKTTGNFKRGNERLINKKQ